MGTKTISIMDDVYNLLVRHKKSNESFSQEIRRLVPKKKDIMEFAGAWSHLSSKEADDIKKEIIRFRRNSSKTFMKRIEGL